MGYTPQQTEEINKTTHEITNQFYGFLSELVLKYPDLATRFNKLMSEVKLPYIDDSGTLNNEHLTKIYLERTLEKKIKKMESLLEKLKATPLNT